MKFQLCSFVRDAGGPVERGIAKMTIDFDFYGVDFIIDINGNKLKKQPVHYELISGLAYCAIDTGSN